MDRPVKLHVSKVRAIFWSARSPQASRKRFGPSESWAGRANKVPSHSRGTIGPASPLSCSYSGIQTKGHILPL
ncbi:uncharacterized protein K444DRAFT_620364 [Hyaloscypha bicolor E]|uniref:Uncharacterized protein n=1 Tax=Hyaloscypha bicolor E TaxID=1095630 RepID=A0A2J6SKD8_9HELO|nr:uncharacterized protein K444DRAFT_620364 [Hyaloscypha bicolor E]PMD51215.1 hypothetical protein K444DRAFT_620364 [Hyaloscypha bicolor E]